MKGTVIISFSLAEQ